MNCGVEYKTDSETFLKDVISFNFICVHNYILVIIFVNNRIRLHQQARQPAAGNGYYKYN